MKLKEFINKIMGRPQDVQRRHLKNNEIEKLVEAIKSQNKLIEKQQELLSDMLLQNKEEPVVINQEYFIKKVDELVVEEGRPQLDDYYINPSTEISVKDSNLGSGKTEGVTVKDDALNDKANKLRELLKNKK